MGVKKQTSQGKVCRFEKVLGTRKLQEIEGPTPNRSISRGKNAICFVLFCREPQIRGFGKACTSSMGKQGHLCTRTWSPSQAAPQASPVALPLISPRFGPQGREGRRL